MEENEKILTIQEFLKSNEDYCMELDYEDTYLHKAMKDFAEYHVKLALQKASEDAKVGCFREQYIIFDDKEIEDSEDSDYSYKIVKESILNSYNLDDIK